MKNKTVHLKSHQSVFKNDSNNWCSFSVLQRLWRHHQRNLEQDQTDGQDPVRKNTYTQLAAGMMQLGFLG